MLSHRSSSEQGSMPLVILAAIVVGGIVISLFTYVQGSQRSSLDDVQFTQAIQAADTGAQAAATLLATDPPPTTQSRACGTGSLEGVDPASGGACPAGGVELPDEPWRYAWEARRGLDGRWEIRAFGGVGQSQRIVELTAGESVLFPSMLFGEEYVEVSGGGSTDFGVFDENGLVATTPLIIGSNDSPPEVDGNYESTAVLVCYGPDCTTKERLTFDDIAAFAFMSPSDVDATPEGHPARDSDYTGVCSGEDADPLAIPNGANVTWTGNPSSDVPAVMCVSEISVGRNVTATVADGPVQIFVEPGGGVTMGGAGQGSNLTLVNLTEQQADDPSALPVARATDLQIYVSGGTVDFSNNSLRIAATLYAPTSFCDFRSQATMLGAAICGSVEANGGFKFWYDMRASELTGARWNAVNYSEQFPSTSNFGWATD